MTRFLKGTDRPLAEAYQLALLDLDGVVYLSLIHISEPMRPY